MKSRTIVALGALAALLLVLAFFQTPVMRTARLATWSAVTALVGKAGGLGDVEPAPEVYTQINRLQAENIRLKAQLRDYVRLQTQLGSPAFESYQPVAARIVGRPIDTFQSQVVVNKGIRDGVSIGSPAVIHGSVLIGFITEVNERSAVVTSLLHPQTNLTAETVPTDSEKPAARGLLQARHFTSLHLTTIPKDIELIEGESVITTAREGAVPAGLTIGSLTNILSLEHEAYQEARVVLPYDIDRLDAVVLLVAP
ncbi:MAG: rod shape-determining protein MreC [Candidatus Andersenbacteria bacterium]